MNELVSRFNQLEVELNKELFERKDPIHTALVAVCSKTHHFQLGDPGTAKTLLVVRLVKRIAGLDGNSYFHWLLTKQTVLEEIFGPPSLPVLVADGTYKRNTSFKAPEAEFVFYDEVFNGSSATLNANLTLMNERLWFNDGKPVKAPLISMFSAANHLPAGEETQAIWDRLHFRHEILPIQEPGNFIRMLQQELPENPETIIAKEDIFKAHEIIEQINVPVEAFEALHTLKLVLKEDSVFPSDRRFHDAVRIIKAEAFLNGHEEVEVDDLRVLAHVMWSNAETAPKVARRVLELAAPLDRKAQKLLDELGDLDNDLSRALEESDNRRQLARAGVEIKNKMVKLNKEIDDLKKEYDQSGYRDTQFRKLQERYLVVGDRLMKEVYAVDRWGLQRETDGTE